MCVAGLAAAAPDPLPGRAGRSRDRQAGDPERLFVPLRLVEAYDGRSGAIWVAAGRPVGQATSCNSASGSLDGRIQIVSDLPANASVVIDDQPELREGRAARPAAGGKGHDVNLALKDIRHNLGRFLADLHRAEPAARHRACDGRDLSRADRWNRSGSRAPRGAHVWVVEGGTRGPFAESSRLPGDTREIDRRAMGCRGRGSGRLSECRGAASRHHQASAGGRRRDRPARRSDRPGRRAGRSCAAAMKRLPTVVRSSRSASRSSSGATPSRSSGSPRIWWHPAAIRWCSSRCATRRSCNSTSRRPRRGAKRPARPARPASTDTVNAVLVRLLPGVDAKRFAQDIERWKQLAALTQDRAGERARPLRHRARAASDRPVHEPAADGVDRDHRAHHLHDDDRQEEIDRHAQADRRARSHASSG